MLPAKDAPYREAVGVPSGKSGVALQLEGLGWLSWYMDWRRPPESLGVVEGTDVWHVKHQGMKCLGF